VRRARFMNFKCNSNDVLGAFLPERLLSEQSLSRPV
jgi:hypothetical protein